jgi:hypothetical protein
MHDRADLSDNARSAEQGRKARPLPAMAARPDRYDAVMRFLSTPGSARQRTAWCALLVAVGLGGCAFVEDKAQDLLASRTSATAVAGGRLLEGQVVYNQSRAGTLRLHSLDAPVLDCFGDLRLTSTSGGVASMSCSDGQMAVVPFQLLGALRAAGRGAMGEAVFSLTYGLPPEMAAPYLGVAIEQLARPSP